MATLLTGSSAPTAADGAIGTANIPLVRVRHIGSLQVLKTRLEEFMCEANEKYQLLAKAVDAEEGDIKSNLQSALVEVSKVWDNVCAKGRTTLEDFAKMEAKLGRLTSKAEMDGVKSEADAALKRFSKTDLTPFNRAARNFKKSVDEMKRKKSMAGKSSSRVAVAEAPPPAHAVAISLLGLGELNRCSSSFEAKSGLRAAVLSPADDEDPASAIVSWAKSKKAFKDITTHLKANKNGNQIVSDAAFEKKLIKELKKGFDPALFSKCALPDEDWSKKVFSPYFMGYNKGFTMGVLNPMGLVQCRQLFKGKEILIGVPLARNPPATIKQIRKEMTSLPVDQLVKYVTDHNGFAVQHGSEELVVLPSGFLTLTVTVEDVMGLYWSCSSDEQDTTRVASSLGQLMSEFPEAANSSLGHSQFREWLLTSL